MANFRLHLDVPLGEDEQKSAEIIEKLVRLLGEAVYNNRESFPEKLVVQYRMGNDNDRSPRNYLQKDSNGHVGTNKTKIIV